MPFSTYNHGVRYDRPTKTLQPIVKRLTKLASAPLADLDDLVGTEVRVTLPSGTERLYAVLAQDPRTGVLHLKDVEGHDTVISH
jgi:hypothetical protein